MSGSILTAPELLTNKGIRFETWRKWDKTSETLPHTGQKQYEPNNSWLQNKQIENGLKDRTDLIGVERVNRSSQLAAAEWLHEESRARVTKKSGQEWTSFGLEENFKLYLIPEEALLLLELNCLQLSWKGVALSIHQAYSVLIESDRSECKTEEYRVYSHLVRQGYKVQRFRYKESSTTHDRSNQSQQLSTLEQKKQTYDSTNVLGITTEPVWPEDGDKSIDDDFASTKRIQCNLENGNSNMWTKSLNEFESNSQCKEYLAHRSCTTVSSDITALKSGCLKKDISEDHRLCAERERITACGSHIEARCLPVEDKSAVIASQARRKLPSELYDEGEANVPGRSNAEVQKMDRNDGKDSKLQIISDETLSGKFKMIPKWLGTRTESNVDWMLNNKISKNISSTLSITNDKSIKIDTVRNKDPSQTQGWRMEICQKPRSSGSTSDKRSNARKRDRTDEVIEVSDDEIEELPQKLSRMEMLNLFPNIMSEAFMPKRIPRRYLPRNIWPQKISNSDSARSGATEFSGSDRFSLQSRLHNNAKVTENSWEKTESLGRGLIFRQKIWTNMGYHSTKKKVLRFMPCDNTINSRPTNRRYSNSNNRRNVKTNVGGCTFKAVSGAMSWSETKAKWSDDKTITIEDEDWEQGVDPAVDASEIKVVAQPLKALVGEKNSTSLVQVYKSLQIIRRARSNNSKHWTKERQTHNYRISYNLYSTNHHFRKANPGSPMYRIVVLRSEDIPFIESVEIERLKKDAEGTPILLACTSHTTVTFAELSTINIPGLWDNSIQTHI